MLHLPTTLIHALRPVTVVVGHYGVGKTNFALNLVLDLAQQSTSNVRSKQAVRTTEGGELAQQSTSYVRLKAKVDGKDAAMMSCVSHHCENEGKNGVVLIDLDVVNPYFRASEHRRILEAHNITLIGPVFAEAGSSLDVPSLSGAIIPALQDARVTGRSVIVDVGGDDVGAQVLGRFASILHPSHPAVLYVVNRFRNLTQTPDEALSILREIEASSHLKATALVDNSHLKEHTSWATIEAGKEFVTALSEKSGLPIACITLPTKLTNVKPQSGGAVEYQEMVYPIEVQVRTPWESF